MPESSVEGALASCTTPYTEPALASALDGATDASPIEPESSANPPWLRPASNDCKRPSSAPCSLPLAVCPRKPRGGPTAGRCTEPAEPASASSSSTAAERMRWASLGFATQADNANEKAKGPTREGVLHKRIVRRVKRGARVNDALGEVEHSSPPDALRGHNGRLFHLRKGRKIILLHWNRLTNERPTSAMKRTSRA